MTECLLWFDKVEGKRDLGCDDCFFQNGISLYSA